MKKNKIIFALSLLIIFMSNIHLEAQTSLSSPYSRFGLGELSQNNNPYNMAMGGITQGLRSNTFVNYSNPASYTSFDTLAFVFNGGFNGYWKTLQTSSISQNTDYFTMSDLSIGIPVTRWLKIAGGMSPYSNMGYFIKDENIDETFGRYFNLYDGTGGVNKTYVGAGVNLWDHLSIGANYNYVWGDLVKSRAVAFPDSLFMKHTQVSDITNLKSHYFDFGVQYHQEIAKNTILTIGATFTPSQKFNATSDELAFTYKVNSANGLQSEVDTIYFNEGSSSKITMPQSYGGGFTIHKPGRYRFGADFKFQEWEKFQYLGQNDSLSNSYQISLGGEITPKNTTLSNYFKFMTYRFGARYGKSYLNLNNTQLDEFGISFGIGLPLKRSRSAINLGFEYGGRGTIENNLIKEDFFKVTLGVSIYEIWFIQRKFD